MDLPTIEMLPTISEVRMTISRRGQCRLGLFSGDTLDSYFECHAGETERLSALLGAVQRIVTAQHEGQTDGQDERRREVRPA